MVGSTAVRIWMTDAQLHERMDETLLGYLWLLYVAIYWIARFKALVNYVQFALPLPAPGELSRIRIQF